MYAILSHGGRQYRVSAGDRMVVDRLDAQVGSVVALEPVLLTGGDGTTTFGADVDGLRVAVTVIAHRRGEKLRIFKYKAKKRSRKMAGYRSDLTELRVDSILAKGAALPAPTTARASAESSKAAARPAQTPRAAAPKAAPKTPPAKAETATASAAAKKSAAAKPAATTTPPKATAKATPKRAPKRRAASSSEESGDGA